VVEVDILRAIAEGVSGGRPISSVKPGPKPNKVLEIDEMLGSPLPNGDRDELECR
jgi:hypothetical protein